MKLCENKRWNSCWPLESILNSLLAFHQPQWELWGLLLRVIVSLIYQIFIKVPVMYQVLKFSK